MSALRATVAFFLVGGVLLGAGIGSYVGYRMGVREGLTADLSARDILASQVTALQTLNNQQRVSLQTLEASIHELTRTIEDQQRSHEYDTRELALYRRIESGGLDRGIHVDDIELDDAPQGPVLRVTLLQVGARNDALGALGVTLIGADLPGAVDDTVVLAGGPENSALEFDFRFMSRIAVPLPDTLPKADASGKTFAWLDALDMVEVHITPRDSRRRPKRVTIPADRMTLGLAE